MTLSLHTDESQIKGKTWMLDPYSEEIQWLCYAVGGILLAWFGSTCSLRGKGHCRSIQSPCWGISFILWWHISWAWSLPGWQSSHPQGTRGHWMVLMSVKMMWVMRYGLHSHHISTQLNTYGRFWTDVLDSALHHHHQNTKWGNIFWKNGVHPSSRVQRLVESMPRRTEAALVAQHLTETLNVGFSFNLSPVCSCVPFIYRQIN